MRVLACIRYVRGQNKDLPVLVSLSFILLSFVPLQILSLKPKVGDPYLYSVLGNLIFRVSWRLVTS